MQDKSSFPVKFRMECEFWSLNFTWFLKQQKPFHCATLSVCWKNSCTDHTSVGYVWTWFAESQSSWENFSGNYPKELYVFICCSYNIPFWLLTKTGLWCGWTIMGSCVLLQSEGTALVIYWEHSAQSAGEGYLRYWFKKKKKKYSSQLMAPL